MRWLRVSNQKPLLAGVGLAILLLQGWAIAGQSLVWDEPYHLLAGRQIRCQGTNSLNLEHPPLVKMVGAVPLQCDAGHDVLPNQALAESRNIFHREGAARRGQIAGRSLVWLLAGAPFLILCYVFGRQIGGPRTGFFLLASMGLSASVIPFLGLVNTDAILATAFLVVAMVSLRYVEAPSHFGALALGMALGLALAGKHSGLLLAPIVGLVPWLTGIVHQRKKYKALLDMALSAVVAGTVLFLTYALANWDYEPSTGILALEQYIAGQGTLVTEDRLEPWRSTILSLHGVRPELAQWVVGILGIGIQDSIGIYPSYAFGQVSSSGRWWYFPVVFIIKTPWPLLILLGLGMVSLVRRSETWWRQSRPQVYILGSIPAIYLLAAMTSNYNLGFRHLLPILPFIFLPAAHYAAKRPRLGYAMVAWLLVEAFVVGPLWMSSTNTWWLGAHDPLYSELSDSNFDYGQNLVPLAQELGDRGIEAPRVIHPVLSEAKLKHYIPTAELPSPGHRVQPGWYVVGVMLDQYDEALRRHGFDEVYQGEAYAEILARYRPLLRSLRTHGIERGVVAGTFRLVEVPPFTKSEDMTRSPSAEDDTIVLMSDAAPVTPHRRP